MTKVPASGKREAIDHDGRKVTFEWAKQAVQRLRNFTGALQSSENDRSLSWYFVASIHEVLESFYVLKDQKSLLAFESFTRPSGKAVSVFGTSYASYHTAVKKVLADVARALWFPIVFEYDESPIAKENEDLTRIDIEDVEDITSAFCNATKVELKGVNSLLLELGAGLCTEYPTFNGNATSDSEEKSKPTLPTATDNNLPSVTLDPPRITINRTAYVIKPAAATLLDALVKAEGDWVSGSKIVKQASRVVAAMPNEVRKLVQSESGKGTRIRPQK